MVVLDLDGKHPVILSSEIRANRFLNTHIDYSLYGCEATGSIFQRDGNQIVIKERMVVGVNKCLPSSYRFVLKQNRENLVETIIERIVNITDAVEVETDIISSNIYYSPMASFQKNNRIADCKTLLELENIDTLLQYRVLALRADNSLKCDGVEEKMYVLTKNQNSLDADVAFMRSLPSSSYVAEISNIALERVAKIGDIKAF